MDPRKGREDSVIWGGDSDGPEGSLDSRESKEDDWKVK